MGALFSRVKTWTSTENVTYSDLNAEFDNILNNLTAANVDDYSANVSQMQSVADPGEVGSESLATSVAGEIQRLRKLISEITGEDEWYESPVSSILGLANSIGTGLTNNRIVSGLVRSAGTNEMPVFLKAAGTATTATVQGTSTNFIYYVNGVEYTISTNVSLTGLTAAPSSNNTCLINDAQAADDYYTKGMGEDGSSIPVDNMGSEITALVGKFAAFKIAGTTDEYFLAYVESTTALSKGFRGYFFDSSSAPVPRAGYSNNDTITLMKLTWVFAKTDGTLTATYNNPIWSKDEPGSPSIGDYWFDLANNTWKVYGVGSYSSAGATLIGVCIQDSTNCVASRSFEFFAGYDDLNTYELFYDSATQVKSRFPGSVANVWGETIKAERNLRTWDITLDRDSGVNEDASTYYFAYLTQIGDVVISNIKPHDRREDLQGYYHPFASWRCIGSFFNDGSSNIDANSVNSYYSRFGQDKLIEASAAYHVEVLDKKIRLSGNSAAEYLPPAAKTRGQEITFIHGGTTLTQIYTLTAFGSETFNTNAATTYKMHTAGETLKVYSDGVGYIVLDHFAQTQWVSTTNTVQSTGGGAVKGTMANDVMAWRRNGSDAEFYMRYVQSAGGTAGSAGDYLVSIPANIPIDTSFMGAYTTVEGTGTWVHDNSMGTLAVSYTGVSDGVGHAIVYDANTFRIFLLVDSGGSTGEGAWSTGRAPLNTTAINITGFMKARITDWEP